MKQGNNTSTKVRVNLTVSVIQLDAVWCLHLNNIVLFAIYLTVVCSVVNKHNKEIHTKTILTEIR